MNNLYDNTILPMKLNLRLNLRNFREWEKELRNVLTSHGLESRLYIPVESKYTEKYGAERHAEIVSAAEKIRELILESIPTCWKRRFRHYELTILYKCLRAICEVALEH